MAANYVPYVMKTIYFDAFQAAIWHCLNHYAYQDATFLAERLWSEGTFNK